MNTHRRNLLQFAAISSTAWAWAWAGQGLAQVTKRSGSPDRQIARSPGHPQDLLEQHPEL